MLRHSEAFSALTCASVSQCYEFYGKTLGLKVELNNANVLILNIKGGSPIIIYENDNHLPSAHTVLNFPVEDVELMVYKLKARGVNFLKENTYLSTDEEGIARNSVGSDMAWFRDPSGNILALVEQVLENT